MVFGHKRGQGCPWDGLVVLWDPSGCLALYDGYLVSIDGFCSADVIGGNQKVSYLVLLDGFFYGLCRRPSYEVAVIFLLRPLL